jgi:hypothetical protein
VIFQPNRSTIGRRSGDNAKEVQRVDIDAITPALVTNTLKAWRQLEEPPAGLLDMDLLQDGTAGRMERGIHLRELVEDLVSAALDRHRHAEGIDISGNQPTRDGLLAAIGRDFAGNNPELEAWSALHHRYLVPVPFSVEELAASAHLDTRNFRRRVTNGVQRLTDALRRREIETRGRLRHARLSRHLPPPEYARLFGVDAAQREVAGLLRRPSGPDYVSIEGLGGIGKTALARAVAHDLAQSSDFDGIAWVSARQTWLNDQGAIEATPDAATTLADIVSRLATQLGFAELAGLSVEEKLERLTAFLSGSRHLIVIDNLENVSDVALLMPALAPLARPARFLLTSRQTLSHYPMVTRYPVRPLSPRDSQDLVEAELQRHGRAVALRPEDMVALYNLIGGMPLALKLVAAQMSNWPLPVLLENLRTAHARAPEGLYTFIYQRSWLALGDPARQLLLSLLPLAPDGEDVEWLALLSFLPPDEFAEALAQLRDYSLLEMAGPPESPRYRLHRLTTTFLQTEVLDDWGSNDG